MARPVRIEYTGAISAQVARLPGLIEKDGRLARRIREIEKRLDAERVEAAGGRVD